MAEYLTIAEVVEKTSKSVGYSLVQVPGKKIMYHGTNDWGKTYILCTPQASLQSGGFWWADITEVQRQLLDSYDEAHVIFRLQGNKFALCSWSTLRQHLTQSAMKNNDKEGNHWKLYIYSDKIEVKGNSKVSPLRNLGNDNFIERF